jgi:hypothetical protein
LAPSRDGDYHRGRTWEEDENVTTPARGPSVVEERRRIPERRRSERRAEDRSRYPRTAAAAAVAICGGLSIVYLFFAAFGAIDLEAALVATVIALVMGLVWIAGYLLRHRQSAVPAAPGSERIDRERRGF